jgi:predicted nucleic acid-binding protein
VLQEFYVTVTRKFAKQLTQDEILLATRTLSALPVVRVSVEMIFSAIDLVRRLQLSFWDGLILQAALKSGCTLLFSEDLQHGQRIGNLRIENPFL